MKKVIKFLKFRDARGQIINIFDFTKNNNIKSALIITSKKGAIRANHYHKTDTHYVYLISGKFRYYERSIKDNSKTISIIVKTGELVKTEAKIIHAMKFIEDTVMLVLTTETREQKKYETDLVRIKLI
jgi:dTDP-4-dehydrorhamnose 3,5-epimerase-like enzyme